MPTPPPLINIQRGDQRYGPYAVPQVQELLAENRLQGTDLAWHDGMTAPQPLAALLRTLGVAPAQAASDASLKWVLPVGRSPWAIAAGYAGLFSVLVFPGPIALVLALLALRDFKKKPELQGRGRAWFALVMGALGTALLLLFAISALAH